MTTGKYDPNTGEKFPGNYNYNPVTGIKLITQAPNVPVLLSQAVAPALGVPPPPPPPPPPLSQGARQPLRIAGEVQAGNLIFHPNPVYPPLARTARVQGSVILAATIAEDGTVRELSVVNSPNPLLVPGVLETVKTWKYKPTLLNNQPVQVITTITINFTLGTAIPGTPDSQAPADTHEK